MTAETPPTIAARVAYGRHVVRQAMGVLAARLMPRVPASRPQLLSANRLFAAAIPTSLSRERSTLERFDLYLHEVMNSRRLQGQIVFEYGTLLRAVERWRGLRVLDVGTGRSTFPGWMSHEGAVVTTLDLVEPAERRLGGFQARVNDIVGRRPGRTRPVAGSMRCLPFRADSFDLVTSLSVVEHLDTDLPNRSFVPYDEQQRRLAHVLEEMIRVTAPGGRIYLTSECCDFERATTDAWKPAYYYIQGPPLSGAWPVRDVPRLFYDFFAARGCTLVGGVQFDPADLARDDHWTWRGGYFGGFSVLAEKQ